jgi:trk system potassium uptake protein
MKVAIAGGGNVGASVAADLCASGHDVLIIESDLHLVERLQPTMACQWFSGDACEVKTLSDAGLADTDVVVAATGDDEDNLVISLLAKQEFGVPRVIARVNHPKNRWLFNETWGVDVSVSTPHLMTALVEEAVSVGTLVRLLHFAEGQAQLVEVTLADDTPAKGRAIADLGVPRDASIVAIIRERRVVVPRGDTRLDAGDEVIALVTEDSEDALRQLLVGALV